MLKYKNYVFDMANTLIDYDSSNVIHQFTEDEELIKKISIIIFDSSDWLMLDSGLITEEKALKHMLTRCDTEEEKKVLKESFKHWHEYNMWPKKDMDKVVIDLKEQGAKIYVLSNAGVRLRKCYKQVMPVTELYDGVLFSAEVQYIKPQEKIYEIFFEKFDLDPKECFFMDDVKENIEVAKKCGMNGYIFDGNIEKLRKVLFE